jgi:Transposase DDE domain
VAVDGSTALLVWDESVLEKPESLHLEGLGPVRSTKAVRLKRIKPGFYNPPGGRPIIVPGLHWLMVTVLGASGPPTLANLSWWTARGERATDRRTVENAMLTETSRRWGQTVIHIWDRGFAGKPWLTMAFVHAVRFVMRWPKHYHLIDEQLRERKAWEITRGKRSWGKRLIYDARRRCQRKVGIVAVPVFDPQHGQPLTLVVARPGGGREPWYLLTNEPVRSEEEAWRIVFAYARRWQVETMFRYSKSELAFESIRLQRWEPRQKLLLMATLAQAFLLTFLQPRFLPLTTRLLRDWCHRTGKRSRETPTPLYRIRVALSHLLLTHPPPLLL